MGKPTREEFKDIILAAYPGAFVERADRGLLVNVGSANVADAIVEMARDRGLIMASRVDGHETVTIRLFGFPRPRRLRIVRRPGEDEPETTYWPADAEDENLRAILERILRLAEGLADPPWAIVELARRGLELLAGKDAPKS